MLRTILFNVVVCIVFSIATLTTYATAYSVKQAAGLDSPRGLFAPAAPIYLAAADSKPKPEKIRRVAAIQKVKPCDQSVDPRFFDCVLPEAKPRGWELDAEVLFARTKGRIRYIAGSSVFGLGLFQNEYTDLNADIGIPDHNAIATFSIKYRLRPNWSLRYSIMPMSVKGSTQGGSNFQFGRITTFNASFGTSVGWDRIYQRAGLIYDPIRTPRARVSIVGEYARVDEKITVIQVGCCGDTFDHDLNMGMAGLEFERCLRTARYCDTLSLECRAAIAFFDQAVGSDVRTGLKYKIPMGSGRWGYLEGGYRYLNFKKGYSDFKLIDTAMDGGYLKMGFVF